jgi:hypothetical protein
MLFSVCTFVSIGIGISISCSDQDIPLPDMRRRVWDEGRLPPRSLAQRYIV